MHIRAKLYIGEINGRNVSHWCLDNASCSGEAKRDIALEPPSQGVYVFFMKELKSRHMID